VVALRVLASGWVGLLDLSGGLPDPAICTGNNQEHCQAFNKGCIAPVSFASPAQLVLVLILQLARQQPIHSLDAQH
jgi:hypothetical protein